MSDLKVNEIKTDTIKNQAGTNAMTIDSSGRVLKPAHPAFMAGVDTTISLTTSYVELANVFTDVNINIGNHYNSTTGRFTAPVTGVYNF